MFTALYCNKVDSQTSNRLRRWPPWLTLSVHIRNDRVFLYSFSNGFNSLLGHLKRFCNSGCDGRQGGIMLKCRDHLFLNHENYMYFAIHLITRTK